MITENDTVIAVTQDFSAIFNAILRVLPDTKTAVVINGASPNERFWRGEMQRDLKPFEGRLKFLWFDDKSFEGILREAASLPPDTAIFWFLMSVDAAGVPHEGDTALKKLYAVSDAPIFTYNDGFFGREVVGGPMYANLETGEKVAAAAVRILGGEKAASIKTGPIQYAGPKYDWRLMQRWSISESRLPPGSEVYFREPGLWESYRWQLLLIITVILLQSTLIIGLT
jgi:hypothetical protein